MQFGGWAMCCQLITVKTYDVVEHFTKVLSGIKKTNVSFRVTHVIIKCHPSAVRYSSYSRVAVDTCYSGVAVKRVHRKNCCCGKALSITYFWVMYVGG